MKVPHGIEREVRVSGDRWRVRYRDAAGARRSRTFTDLDTAAAFQAQVRLAARAGDLGTLDAGRQLTRDFAAEWWRDYAATNLTARTRAKYATCWNAHALGHLGHLPLRQVTPQVIGRMDATLAADGVGPEARRATLVMLQSMLRAAVLWGRLPTNPVAHVRKPGGKRARAVQPPGPELVEALRAELLAAGRPGSAALACTLAYAGLRPQEALALRWQDVRDATLLVQAKNVDGEVLNALKHHGHKARAVELLPPLAADLAEWRLRSGRPDPSRLVFHRPDLAAWRDTDYRNWRVRTYAPAAAAAGLSSTRPYDLRHAFASLLLAAGRNVVEVAALLGHSPAMTLRTYAHLLPEYAGRPAIDPVAEIEAARHPAPALVVSST